MAVSSPSRLAFVSLLVATLLKGIAWAALIPMWHTPDEQAHFAQAQNMVSGWWVDVSEVSTSEDIVTAEKRLGTFRQNGNNFFTYHPEYRIPYRDAVDGFYESELENLPLETRLNFPIAEATGYPPLYYWYVALVNWVFWPLGLISRVFISRVATVMISTLGVWATYRLGKTLFQADYLAIALAAGVSFHPMWSFVSSGVTSDALMNALYPLGLVALIRHRQRPTLGRLTALIFILLLLWLTKPQWVLLMLVVIPALWWPDRKKVGKLMLSRIQVRILVGLWVLLGGIAAGRQISPTFEEWVWETDILSSVTLPEITNYQTWFTSPSVVEYLKTMVLELYRQGFPWYWGVYRWLSLTLPLLIYRIIKVVILISAVGWAAGIINRRVFEVVRSRMALFIVLASVVVYSVGILGWNFFYWRSHGYSFGIQGRYFFPNLPEHVLLILLGLILAVPQGWRRLVAWTSSTAMVIFNIYSLWYVAGSYYDNSRPLTFFRQASQYKPWFFKLPYLPVILGLAMVSLAIFLYFLYDQSHQDAK